jgi:exopolysaccharide production protein ExoQ
VTRNRFHAAQQAGSLLLAAVLALGVGWAVSETPEMLSWFLAAFVIGASLLLLGSWQTTLAATVLTLILALTPIPAPFWSRFLLLGALLAVILLTHPPRRPASRQQGVFILGLEVFLAFSALSLLWTDHRRLVAAQVLAATVLLGTIAVAGLGRWRDSRLIQRDLVLLYVVIAGFSLASIVAGTLDDPTARLSGYYRNPNALGMMSALAFGLGLGVHRLAGRWRLAVIATQATLLIGVVHTGSRTSTAAVLAALLYPLRDPFVRGRLRLLLPWVLSGLATAALIGLALPERFRSNLLRTWDALLSPDARFDSGRDRLWEGAVEAWLVHPVGGHGFRSGPAVFRTAHSGYFQLLGESGVIGSAILAVVLVAVLVPRGPKDPALRPVWLAGTGAVVAGLVVLFGESAVFGFGQPFPLVFWAAASMAVAANANVRAAGTVAQDPEPKRLGAARRSPSSAGSHRAR